jgi:hypothetical protein
LDDAGKELSRRPWTPPEPRITPFLWWMVRDEGEVRVSAQPT